MVSDLPRIQSSRVRAAPRVFVVALTHDFSLYDRAGNFLGLFRCYSCLVPPGVLLTACSEKSFVV
jgi:hypothetical protein